MNDGAIAYRDLSLRSNSVTYDFLNRCWDLFNAISEVELPTAPGARMVVATGFRMRGRRGGLDAMAGHLSSLLQRLVVGKIDIDQAIREAVRSRPSFDVIPQLQANYAFTKAYIAERSGRSGGLEGAQCFVELSLFEAHLPSWLEVGDPIHWRHDGLALEAVFAPLRAISVSKRSRAPNGIRDGLQIAQYLARDADVLQALRAESHPHQERHRA